MKFFICLMITFSALAAEKAKQSRSLVSFNYEFDNLTLVSSDVATNKAGPYQVLTFSGKGLVGLSIQETSQVDLKDKSIKRSGSSILVKFRLDNFKDADSFKQLQECRILAQRWAVYERGINLDQGGSYRVFIHGQKRIDDSKIRGILKAKNPIFEMEVNPQFEKVECRVERYQM